MTLIAYTVSVNEKTTAEYTAILVDELGAVLGSDRLSTMVVTIYDKNTGAIINSRSAQNILNTNGGSLDTLGNFALILSQLDNPILDDTLDVEVHLALFAWTYGSKGGNRTIAIRVNNTARIT